MFRTILFAIMVGLVVCLPPGRFPRPPSRDAVSSVHQLLSGNANTRSVEDHLRTKPAPIKDNDDTILVEKDMKMSKSYYDYLHGKTKVGPRKGLRDEKYRWTNNTIPYTIASYFKDSEKQTIRRAMDEWEKYTCLQLTPRTNEQNYVHFISDVGCWSWIGMIGGKQELSLQQDWCTWHRTSVHELGHAVGYHHEQARPDRDTFVKIIPENIQPGQEDNFHKYDSTYLNDFGVTYDYWSVMHYGAYEFSTGPKAIQTLNKDFEDVIGTAPGLSFKDIHATNKMYKCDEHCTNECPAKAIRTKDCKCWCNSLNPVNPVVEWDEVSECKGGDDFTDTCVDFDESCPYWASVGECEALPRYMVVNCRKSCQVCGANPVCKDYLENCQNLRVMGKCNTRDGELFCRKTCEFCGEQGTTPGV